MDRNKLIELLDQSFQALDNPAKLQLLCELNLPRINPRTQTEFSSFAEILRASCNFTLTILVEEFKLAGLLDLESCG